MTNLDNVIWGDFKLGDLFDIERGKEKAPKQTPDGPVPLIIETTYNNGFTKNCTPTKKFKGNCISISINFAQNVFYQPVELGASVNIALLYHKENKLTRGSGLFIATLLRKINAKYDYSMKISNDKIKDTTISLPIITNGDPDYAFMEEFIKDLEQERIKELEQEKITEEANYLQVTGLSDTKLTKTEQKALDDFDSLTWGDFKLGDLFDKLNLKFTKDRKFDKNNDVSRVKTTEFNLPLVNAKSGDNGIMYYGRDIDFASAEKTIAIISDGAVSAGDCHPQIEKTGVLYNAYLIKPKETLKRLQIMFLTTSIYKVIKKKYSYEYKAGWDKVKDDIIKLPLDPTDPTKPDYKYMETYIKAIEKLTIKDVVDLKDEQIVTTKKVV